MESIRKTQHLIIGTDYVVDEVQTTRAGKPDFWIGRVGSEKRRYVGSDWKKAIEQIGAGI